MRNKLLKNKEYVRLDGMTTVEVKQLLDAIEETKIQTLPFIGDASDYKVMMLRRAGGSKGAPIGVASTPLDCEINVPLSEFRKRIEARKSALAKKAKKDECE